ncbi:hypothetical protein [Streptomyces synnematoformans]|uniref:hypothetical protein n=1 Tax=Streptomyces synnematoformans TaxID=415721 RepID=UPI0031E482D4
MIYLPSAVLLTLAIVITAVMVMHDARTWLVPAGRHRRVKPCRYAKRDGSR